MNKSNNYNIIAREFYGLVYKSIELGLTPNEFIHLIICSITAVACGANISLENLISTVKENYEEAEKLNETKTHS